ncbi:ATP-grasp ribosomal peptide maturase [Kitasatospora purpeofusca]|uniref:ATP-grasp ribosomal peptide maturase n=1 Tax=Kitasatospora purpeofusca TaxID=67352 RepID=UPI003F4ADAB4
MADTGGSVLVLTNAQDVTADLVLRVLAERAVPAARVDPGLDLHSGASLTASYGPSGRRGILRTPSRSLDLATVRSVWVRRPTRYEGPPELDGQDAGFAAAQNFWGAGGILASLADAHYVNHPWANRAAEYKPAQLAAAGRHGFRVPETLITNDLQAARDFVRRQVGGAVYKPLWNTAYNVQGSPHQVWVRPVGVAELTVGVELCPHLFQAMVGKAFDARVTVVGDRLFATRIDSPDLDWRRRQDRMVCTPVDLPGAVREAVAAYLSEFGLVYGAFDFAVTHSGEWHFLECNPNGQWAWQPPETTAAIARAIADLLERGRDV